MRKSISALAIGMALLTGTALVAGCGGGGSDSTTSGGDVGASRTETEGGKGEAPAGPGGSASTGEAGGGESTDGSADAGSGKSSSDAEVGGGGGERPPNAGGSPGGDAPSTAGGGAPTPKAQSSFAAEANAVCQKQRRRTRARVSVLFKGGQGKDRRSQQETLRRLVTDAIVPGLEAEITGLRKLEPPPGDAGKVETLFEALEAVVAEAHKDPTAFLGDPAAFERPRKLAHESGIDACGTLS